MGLNIHPGNKIKNQNTETLISNYYRQDFMKKTMDSIACFVFDYNGDDHCLEYPEISHSDINDWVDSLSFPIISPASIKGFNDESPKVDTKLDVSSFSSGSNNTPGTPDASDDKPESIAEKKDSIASSPKSPGIKISFLPTRLDEPDDSFRETLVKKNDTHNANIWRNMDYPSILFNVRNGWRTQTVCSILKSYKFTDFQMSFIIAAHGDKQGIITDCFDYFLENSMHESLRALGESIDSRYFQKILGRALSDENNLLFDVICQRYTDLMENVDMIETHIAESSAINTSFIQSIIRALNPVVKKRQKTGTGTPSSRANRTSQDFLDKSGGVMREPAQYSFSRKFASMDPYRRNAIHVIEQSLGVS